MKSNRAEGLLPNPWAADFIANMRSSWISKCTQLMPNTLAPYPLWLIRMAGVRVTKAQGYFGRVQSRSLHINRSIRRYISNLPNAQTIFTTRQHPKYIPNIQPFGTEDIRTKSAVAPFPGLGMHACRRASNWRHLQG
jgi:hypothetical protein